MAIVFNYNASAGFIELHSLTQRTAYSIMKSTNNIMSKKLWQTETDKLLTYS
ncbi:hypothetical protein ACP8HZ_01280 [Francisella noatunensis]